MTSHIGPSTAVPAWGDALRAPPTGPKPRPGEPVRAGRPAPKPRAHLDAPALEVTRPAPRPPAFELRATARDDGAAALLLAAGWIALWALFVGGMLLPATGLL